MTIKKIKTVVIDDEPQVRKTLAKVLGQSIELEVLGTADSIKSGFDLITDLNPDLIFLDIKLIGGDAFQLLNLLRRHMDNVPPVILNTGYNEFEYAQRSLNEFKDLVLMILKKPFWNNWHQKEEEILNKVNAFYKNMEPVIQAKSFIKIKSNYTTHVIKSGNIILVESDPNAKGRGKLTVTSLNEEYNSYNSLGKFLEDLPPNFIRVSRYTIVNIDYIDSYDSHNQLITLTDNKRSKISVGRSYKEKVVGAIGQ